MSGLTSLAHLDLGGVAEGSACYLRSLCPLPLDKGGAAARDKATPAAQDSTAYRHQSGSAVPPSAIVSAAAGSLPPFDQHDLAVFGKGNRNTISGVANRTDRAATLDLTSNLSRAISVPNRHKDRQDNLLNI